MGAQKLQQRLRHRQRLDQKMTGSISAPADDALADVLLGLFTEARQHRHLALQTERLQLFHGGDLQLLEEHLDLLGAEPGDFEHFEQTRREGGLEFLVISQATGGDEFGDFLLQGVAQAFDLAQAILSDQARDRLRQVFDRAGGILIRPRLEGVFPFQFEERPDLHQDGRHLIFFHAANLAVW